MIDILYAAILMLGLRHDAPLHVEPSVMRPGTVENIPDPLPYVIENVERGPR